MKDWWTDNEDKEFRKRSQCFVNQYGNFTVTQLAKMLERLLGFRYLHKKYRFIIRSRKIIYH